MAREGALGPPHERIATEQRRGTEMLSSVTAVASPTFLEKSNLRNIYTNTPIIYMHVGMQSTDDHT